MNSYFAYVFAGVLHREHTLANGDCECDYWVVGDKAKTPH